MHRLSSTLLGLATLFGAVTAAFAGAGVITTTVTRLQDNVTYSTTAPPAMTTYIGYTVDVGNAGGNTINNIVFTGTVSVTDEHEMAVFSSAEGATCYVVANPAGSPANAQTISCAIGQLQAARSYPTFVVFFAAPAKDTASPMPDGNLSNCSATDCVSFAGTTYYAEGTGGVPQSPPDNSTDPWTTGAVALGTANPTLLKSAVPKGGGTFFTGNGGVSVGTDKFATTVVVPPAAVYSTAVVDETTFTQDCTNFTTCWQSDITILGNVTSTYSPYLTIVLRQDASNIMMRPVKIETVLVTYVDNNNVSHGFIGDCASPTTPRTDGLPCIAKRTYYKNRQVPGWTLDLDGDFEWTIISLKNGRFGIQ